MKIKSLGEFLNEHYSSEGTMDSIIKKLKTEGKSDRVIYTYLHTLGVEPARIMEVMSKYPPTIDVETSYKINSKSHRNPVGFPSPSGSMTGVNEGEEAKLDEGVKVYLQIYPGGSKSKSFVEVDKISKSSKILKVSLDKDEKELHDPMFTVGNTFDATEFVGESTSNDEFYNKRVSFVDKQSKKKFVGDVLRLESDGKFKIDLGNKKYMLVDPSELTVVDKSTKITFESINEEGKSEDSVSAELDSLEKDLDKADVEKPEEKEATDDTSIDTGAKEDALKAAVSDIEKLEKIKAILAESAILEAEKPKYGKSSIWTTKSTEEEMRKAGFEWDQKGNTPITYKGDEIGYMSNFNGIMIYADFEKMIVGVIKPMKGAQVWNYTE